MEEVKTAVRIQILPPPSQSPEPGLEKLEPLPRGYTVLLVLAFVFSAVSLSLAFVA